MTNPRATTTSNATKRVIKSQTFLKKHLDFLNALYFLGPSVLILTIFIFYPMIKTLFLSLFLTNDWGHAAIFNGLHNYTALLTNSSFITSLMVTLVYVISVSVLTVAMGLLLAVAAQQTLKGIKLFRTIFSSTMGVSVSVAAIFWLFIFNPSIGLFSKIAQLLHLPEINWLTDPKAAMWAIIISTVWMNLGFTFLILFGALQAFPKTLYDAADIAGTSKTYQLFKITIPMISPTLFFTAIVTFISSFKSFGLIDMMTAGGPNNATNLIVYRIYQDAFINNNYGQSSAESVILTIIIALVTLIQFKLFEKRVTY